MTMHQAPHKVVVVGGGFGGLHVAQRLRRAPVDVTLVDRRNYHLFQPLLYQVATGALSPANVASPLRYILKRQRNARVVFGDVVDILPETREVRLARGCRLPYDTLVLAAGADAFYFGNDEFIPNAPNLKSMEDALDIRRRVLRAFEMAELESDPESVQAWLTFVIVGAGPTGVEMAGALAEIARHTLAHEFRHIAPQTARIYLADMLPRVLPGFPGQLSERAETTLRAMGVHLRTGRKVERITDGEVCLTDKSGEGETLAARTAIWAAGVKPVALAERVTERLGLDEGPQGGKLRVTPALHLPSHPDVFAIGDIAACPDLRQEPDHENGERRLLPGLAPVAIQQGKHVARTIEARLKNKPVEEFRYRDYGYIATIGRSRAVGRLGSWTFSGLGAWLLWCVIHIVHLTLFEDRVLVFWRWAWNYTTWNRAARLILAPDRCLDGGRNREDASTDEEGR